MVEDDEGLVVARPPGVGPDEDVAAAIIDGDGLLPIPSGWLVFFRVQPEAPDGLVGKMAVVRYSGGGDRPVIRTIRRSTEAGMFTLQAFTGALVEDVEIVAAHRVISFAAPE